MKRALVTGCAGFIGSTLAERLLANGWDVIGIDVFTGNYARALKERNLGALRQHPRFTFYEQDLLNVPLTCLLSKTDVVFHQAALPGVRQSWGQNYQEYVNCNILATQRLLEAVKHSNIEKLVYASTSSVYGVTDGPTSETHPTNPISPYGQTKLSAEQLCRLYHHNFQVPYVALRYFTVYGPRQRADMGFHKFILSLLLGEPVTVFGQGEMTRDFTYVDDIVQANLLAADSPHVGEVFNIGGNSRSSVDEVIRLIEKLTGKPAKRQYLPEQPGDPKHTWADIGKAKQLLGYDPQVDLEKGLALQVQDLKGSYGL